MYLISFVGYCDRSVQPHNYTDKHHLGQEQGPPCIFSKKCTDTFAFYKYQFVSSKLKAVQAAGDLESTTGPVTLDDPS